MNILLTNDDGVESAGILELKRAFSQLGNVIIFSPVKDRSGTSQAMTIYEDIGVQKISEDTYAVEGFPTDCVNIGLHGGIVDFKFDLVLSGINRGVNMGEDTLYSGTYGAARHGAVHKLPSFALSYGYTGEDDDFQFVAKNYLKLVQSLLASQYENVLFNINHPSLKNYSHKWRLTKLGRRTYTDSYKLISKEGDHFVLNLGGSVLGQKPGTGTDFEAFDSGLISVTPMSLDGTDFKLLQSLEIVDHQLDNDD